MKGLLGTKIGMTRVYGEDGRVTPVTVLQAGPCSVLALRTEACNGYSALQLGFGSRKSKNVPKSVRTQTAKAGYDEKVTAAWINEIRLDEDPTAAVGDEIGADIFEADEFVDIAATTKGRGFQGVIRRYRFKGGRASHGGDWTRRGGSIGMCESPGKVYKGRKMPGQMGNKRRTVQNLKVVQVRKDENLIFVKGAVPGPNGGQVIIRKSIKK